VTRPSVTSAKATVIGIVSGMAVAIVVIMVQELGRDRCNVGSVRACPGGGIQFCEREGRSWSVCLVPRGETVRRDSAP